MANAFESYHTALVITQYSALCSRFMRQRPLKPALLTKTIYAGRGQSFGIIVVLGLPPITASSSLRDEIMNTFTHPPLDFPLDTLTMQSATFLQQKIRAVCKPSQLFVHYFETSFSL